MNIFTADSPRLTRRQLGYVAACTLPFLAAFLTSHSSTLQLIPFVLFFFAVVLAATLGGMLPALIAVFFCALSRYVFPLPGSPIFPIGRQDTLRYAFLLTSAALVSLIGASVARSHKKLEAALIDLQDRNEALVESLNVSKCASWTWDANGNRSPRWYPGSYPVFGRPLVELEELPSIAPLLKPEDLGRLAALREHMQSSTDPIFFEYQVIWPDGENHWLETRGHHIPGPGQRWRGVTIDITERKLTEAALLRSEKLAAMGRLASTVAHEINNPLEAVTNLLFLASTSGDLTEPAQSYVLMAERELARLANITRLTLGFVRGSTGVASVEVAAVVDSVLSIFHHRLESNNVTVRRNYDRSVTVTITPHELRQIVTNLVANAADALLENPIITLTVEQAGGNAILLVEDNGCGISEQNMPRIFDPFFTTKAEVGTGIGLWVTREIVDRNKGRILAESGSLGPGVTTRFRVELPLTAATPA